MDGLECPNHGFFSHDSRGYQKFLHCKDTYFSNQSGLEHLQPLPKSKLQVGRKFLAPLSNIEPGVWLDVGAGDGVHLKLLAQLVPEATLVGLDISSSVLEHCHVRVPEAELLLADGQAIPFVDNTVDASYSYGVLAYMPDPWSGLAEMVRVTRPGGLIGVWMYPHRGGLTGLIWSLLRLVVPRFPSGAQKVIADCMVPFLFALPTASKLYLGNASWAACREVVLVNIAPPRLFFPTEEEVRHKIEELGCRIIFSDPDAPITLWGLKE